MPARKKPGEPLAKHINHGHPVGSKMFAAHCPGPLAKRIEWAHARYQSLVPTQIRIAAFIRMLLEESVENHIPKDVLEQFRKEEEEDAKKKKR